MNKKGMSPLIATVLLIAFAVALGAMIMNWSTEVEAIPSSSSSHSSSDASCASVAIELKEVFGKPLFCYDTDAIRINVVNSGSVPISGIQLRTIDENLNEQKEIIPESRLLIGGTLPADIPYEKSGKVHVELVPYIVQGAQPEYCVQKRIVQDVLPDCSAE